MRTRRPLPPEALWRAAALLLGCALVGVLGGGLLTRLRPPARPVPPAA